MPVSSNYAQSDLNNYARQFDGKVVDPSQSGVDAQRARDIAQKIQSFTTDTFTQDRAAVGNGQSDYANARYAADIALLHNLESEYAKATGDTQNLARLVANPDQTGLGTTNELLAQAGARDGNGRTLTDKDFTYRQNDATAPVLGANADPLNNVVGATVRDSNLSRLQDFEAKFGVSLDARNRESIIVESLTTTTGSASVASTGAAQTGEPTQTGS